MELGIPGGWVSAPEEVVTLVREAGGEPVEGSLASLADARPDALLIEGDEGVSAAVRAGLDVPLLPLETSPGLEPIDRDSLSDALEGLVAGRGERVRRAGVAARIGGGAPTSGLFDVMVMTTEPATISEYEVVSGDRVIAQYRADGIVVASPTGSSGYARSCGGPVLDPGLDACAVVPISPYRTAGDHWVLEWDDLAIRVARDESDVTLFVDEQAVSTVSSDDPVTIDTGPGCETFRLPQSRSPFQTSE